MFQTKFVVKIKTQILYSVKFFENRAVYEIMWKNIMEPNRPQMIIRGSCALPAGYLKLLTQLRICNIFCSSTATMVASTFYAHCLSCYNQDEVCLLRGTHGIFKLF
jgi:hypothetical protein